jgi:hypothetical protein
MIKQDEFLKQLETILKTRIGPIITGSVLKNNISKINKNPASMTKEDLKIFAENIVKAISLFESRDESKVVRDELEKLLIMFN